jgi:serine phosphatase RsbU (regulator of sigma subunit)
MLDAVHPLSLPFALAPAALLIVITYAAVMRGAPALRGFLLAHCCCILPYTTAMMVSPSIDSPEIMEQIHRVAAGFIPLATAAGTGFQLALLGTYRRRNYRILVWILMANAAGWVAVSTTPNVVDGVIDLGGVYFPHAGPLAVVALVNTISLALVGFVHLGHAALTWPPSPERRQLRSLLLANSVTYAGLIDIAVSFGVDLPPVGWLLAGIGNLLVARALVVEDLLRVRAVDTLAPLLVGQCVACVLIAWACLAQLPADAPWWVAVLACGIAIVGVRIMMTTIALISRGARSAEGPLERLVTQLVTRGRDLSRADEIARLAADVTALGLGTRPTVLLASEDDWGWSTAEGVPLDERHAPDPLVGAWLADHATQDVMFAGDLDAAPRDLRPALGALFAAHDARVLAVVRSRDELLGLLAMPVTTRHLRGRQLAFVERIAERLAEALLHARMARRAAERAGIAREVELAATVQAELLPTRAPHVHGGFTVIGSWQPATRCAGDFWGVYPLRAGRILLAIGDVTGHGVASAMVTAAAAGACEACARRPTAELDLAELVTVLDGVVRRSGGGRLSMTCFAAILDEPAGEIRYVSLGHTTPYLCRSAASGLIELQALVGRGNPLGASVPAIPRVQHRLLQRGDLVVCYTDGVIEAKDPTGASYGDRRLQHLLRRVDPARLSPAMVHSLVQASVATHRSGRGRIDDETIVVAQLARAAEVTA